MWQLNGNDGEDDPSKPIGGYPRLINVFKSDPVCVYQSRYIDERNAERQEADKGMPIQRVTKLFDMFNNIGLNCKGADQLTLELKEIGLRVRRY